MHPRLLPGRRSLRGFALGSAWFFIVVSLLHLVWAVLIKLGSPGGTFKLYHTVVDGVSYDAWALVYTGWLGLLLAIAQLLAVSGAVTATLLRGPRALRWRRAGHLVLVGWSALWMLDLMRLAAIDGELLSYAQAGLLALLFTGTVYRAVAGWSPRRPRPDRGERAIPRDEPAGEPDLTPPDGGAGPRWRSLVTAARLSRLRHAADAARRRTAGGLHRVADFTRRQAERVAPPTGR